MSRYRQCKAKLAMFLQAKTNMHFGPVARASHRSKAGQAMQVQGSAGRYVNASLGTSAATDNAKQS